VNHNAPPIPSRLISCRLSSYVSYCILARPLPSPGLPTINPISTDHTHIHIRISHLARRVSITSHPAAPSFDRVAGSGCATGEFLSDLVFSSLVFYLVSFKSTVEYVVLRWNLREARGVQVQGKVEWGGLWYLCVSVIREA
jgi:hypothetical protein